MSNRIRRKETFYFELRLDRERLLITLTKLVDTDKSYTFKSNQSNTV